MKKGDTVLLQISTVETCTGCGQEIQLQIICPKTEEHIRLVMPLVDYAKVITGVAHVPVTVKRYRGPKEES